MSCEPPSPAQTSPQTWGNSGEGVTPPGPETSGSGSTRGRFLLLQRVEPEPPSVTTEATPLCTACVLGPPCHGPSDPQ